MSRVDQPIFIIGTGRCGSTLFFNLLASHPDLAWFSNYSHLAPTSVLPAVAARARDLPGAPRWLGRLGRAAPKPVEDYEVLNRLTDGRFNAPRRLTVDDATSEISGRFRRFVDGYVRMQGGRRFLHKHTGFARTDFLRAIFPDARFVEVVRDGRAVVASMLGVSWYRGMASWRWGPMRPEYVAELEATGRNPVVLAAIVWKTLMDEIRDETADLGPDRLLRVRYDELTEDPDAVVRGVLDFSGLEWTPQFVARYRPRAREVRDMDHKWAGAFDESDRRLLERSLEQHLRRYGFLPA